METTVAQFNVIYQITGDGVGITQLEIILHFEGDIKVRLDSEVIVSVSFSLPDQEVVISQSLPATSIQYEKGSSSIRLQGKYIVIGLLTLDQITNGRGEIWYIEENEG